MLTQEADLDRIGITYIILYHFHHLVHCRRDRNVPAIGGMGLWGDRGMGRRGDWALGDWGIHSWRCLSLLDVPFLFYYCASR